MKLNYKLFGKEYKPLVILHGLMGSLDNWQTLAKRWSEHFPVYLVDMRNHGRSPHSEVFSYDSMVEDIYEFCVDHDLREINLLGHSMGGKAAMYFALRYPNLVEKLIVADIAPKEYESGHDHIFNAMKLLPLDQIKTRQDADDIMKKHISNDGIRQFVLKNLQRENDGYVWKLNLDAIIKNYDELMKFDSKGLQFPHPTLFIKGENSNYINKDEFESFKTIFPNAALKTIEDTGHWLHAENPGLVYISVKIFAQLKAKEVDHFRSSPVK